jgi:hypothetical protein
MTFTYDEEQLKLPLGLVAVQPRCLVVPHQLVARITSWRQACRLAWRLRQTRISYRTFAQLTGTYAPHVSDYFSVHDNRRELPARYAGVACDALGNKVLAQYLAQVCKVTLLEEMQAARRAA